DDKLRETRVIGSAPADSLRSIRAWGGSSSRISSWRIPRPAIIRWSVWGSSVRVQHRHIIYIQGYDPRGLAQYYRMFRTELRKFGRLYQLQATISRPKVADDDEIASWAIDTTASDWQTRTAYDFLRFEDFIQQDLA